MDFWKKLSPSRIDLFTEIAQESVKNLKPQKEKIEKEFKFYKKLEQVLQGIKFSYWPPGEKRFNCGDSLTFFVSKDLQQPVRLNEFAPDNGVTSAFSVPFVGINDIFKVCCPECKKEKFPLMATFFADRCVSQLCLVFQGVFTFCGECKNFWIIQGPDFKEALVDFLKKFS